MNIDNGIMKKASEQAPSAPHLCTDGLLILQLVTRVKLSLCGAIYLIFHNISSRESRCSRLGLL
jgi:hypothetical protein